MSVGKVAAGTPAVARAAESTGENPVQEASDTAAETLQSWSDKIFDLLNRASGTSEPGASGGGGFRGFGE
jgi:hypothetical protein